MKPAPRRWTTIALAMALAALLAGRTVVAETRSKKAEKREPLVATPQEISAWVQALDADAFAEREEATEKLIAVGKPAIAPLQATNLPTRNLEVISRGMHVLQELALSDDRATEDAAREVLEQLVASNNPATSRRATSTLDTLNEIRQARAIANLQELGVSVNIASAQVGLVFVQDVFTVIIDEKFKGEPRDLKLLQHLRDIEYVQLSGEQVNDEVVGHLAGLPNLASLTIKRAKISNASLQTLSQLPKLQRLSIMYCPVDDRAVELLSPVKTLTEVQLFGTDMTPRGAEKLTIALEGAKVDFRHGAFLGIGCQASPRGCVITLVHPNSAAAKAGLEPGDIIMKFTGEPVADFPALTALIAKYKAGDKVAFEVQRAGGPEKIEVTLGAWD